MLSHVISWKFSSKVCLSNNAQFEEQNLVVCRYGCKSWVWIVLVDTSSLKRALPVYQAFPVAGSVSSIWHGSGSLCQLSLRVFSAVSQKRIYQKM